jgi:two-component system CheB/CheR fusion protein
MSDIHQSTLVVCIGASAGGLKPIETFFSHMPPESGMSFVIVQHLSPDFESLMAELLGRHTNMPVHEVSDGIAIVPNHIYLIPPKNDISISNSKLMLTARQKTGGLNLPIDSFLASLATQFGDKAVAVIMSGSGSDGSCGVKNVQDAGGVILVQTPETAEFDSMPQAAIATDAVDLTCPVDEMPGHLLSYYRLRDRQSLRNSVSVNSQERSLSRLHQYMLTRNKIDFSYYKSGTIRRRLERRMQFCAVASLDEYLERVESDEEEAEMLFRDLLVEVTHFFRDQEAFDILRNVTIPELIEAFDTTEEFRAWVCGCATGEEAYSIAMVIHDCLEKAGAQHKTFKVFATDVHPASLQFAGEGIYAEDSIRNLPARYRAKYFTPHKKGFKVKKEIRQRVIFALNDATKDPPFMRLNFVSCRNLMIYLLPAVQQRLLSVFHFGLLHRGVLFLGPSETMGDLADEFDIVDQQWRLFQKNSDNRLADSTRLPLVSANSETDSSEGRDQNNDGQLIHDDEESDLQLHNLLDLLAPSCLLVDEENELVYCTGFARELLTFPVGKSTNDVLKLLSREFASTVGAALYRCRSKSKAVSLKQVRLRFPRDEKAEDRLYEIKVDPLVAKKQTLYLITVCETPEFVATGSKFTDSTDMNSLEAEGEHTRRLKEELDYARETLQATVEELESSNEELQATNEELIASNEELQSTNEELQSTNEELHTVNQESRHRILQLDEVTEDLELLLSRTFTGILFLDEQLNIRKFTRSITRYIGLRPSDIGRNIDAFSHRTGVPELYQLLRESLETGSEFSMDGKLPNNESLLIEVTLRQEQENMTGLMLTIGNKTTQGFGVGGEQFFLPSGTGFWQWPNVDEDEMWWSPRCYQLLGLSEGDLPPQFSSWRKLIHEDDLPRLRNAGTEQCLFVREGFLVVQMKCADDVYRKFEYRAGFILDDNNRPTSMVGSFSPFQYQQDRTQEPRIHFKSPPTAKHNLPPSPPQQNSSVEDS